MSQCIDNIVNFPIEQRGDVKNWPKEAVELANAHPDSIYHALLGPSCQDSARCQSAKSRQKLGIHGPLGRVTFTAFEGIFNLAKDLQARQSAPPLTWTNEFVIPSCYLDILELNELYGFPVYVNGSDVGCASRQRHLRGSPWTPIPDPTAFVDKRDPCISPSGEQWSPDIASDFPMAIRAHYPKLVTMHIDDMTKFERRTLLDLLTLDTDGSKRFPSVNMIGHWLGITDEFLSAITSTFPCTHKIVTLTGLAPTDDASEETLTTCGKSNYCYNCAVVIERLGRGWNGLNLTNYLVYQLRTIAHVVANEDKTFLYYPYRLPHRCNTHCRS